jgi:hypothetical protein
MWSCKAESPCTCPGSHVMNACDGVRTRSNGFVRTRALRSGEAQSVGLGLLSSLAPQRWGARTPVRAFLPLKFCPTRGSFFWDDTCLSGPPVIIPLTRFPSGGSYFARFSGCSRYLPFHFLENNHYSIDCRSPCACWAHFPRAIITPPVYKYVCLIESFGLFFYGPFQE